MSPEKPKVLLSSTFKPCGVDDAYGRKSERKEPMKKSWQNRGGIFLALCVLILVSPRPALAKSAEDLALIPWPRAITRLPGELVLSVPLTLILPAGAGPDYLRTARIMADEFKSRFNSELTIKVFSGRFAACGPGMIEFDDESGCAPCAGQVLFGEVADACGFSEHLPATGDFSPEFYRLSIDRAVLIQAKSGAGLQHAMISLYQLIDPERRPLRAPSLMIMDQPRFSWRGLMLDPARSFIPPDVVRKYIDHMVELKLNVLHLHLSDDQGWRIESKIYPRLHEQGAAMRQLKEHKLMALDRHGWGRDGRGYYTQQEIRELVSYAADRHIMIVPEIDVPGHSSALLAAYPELSCSGAPVKVRNEWNFWPTALCPGKEEVYEFLDELFGEVSGLFPAPYFHVGGDEVIGGDWRDYPPNQELLKTRELPGPAGLMSYFIGRVHEIVSSHDRTMIAWDETLEFLPEGAVCQAWRDHDYAREAAERGHQVIVSLFFHHYINYGAWDRTMRRLYLLDPVPPGLAPDLHSKILGGEAALWGRQISLKRMDPRTFPRLLAHAEVMWSRPEDLDYGSFLSRLRVQKSRMEKRGVNFGWTWESMLPGR